MDSATQAATAVCNTSPAPSDAHLVPRHRAACLLSGAVARQQRRPHSMNGLVGYALADTKSFATLGVTTYVLGSALAAMPASLWMAKVGRRRGFMTGSLIAVVGTATCALALAKSSFPLFCVGTGMLGVYTAFGFPYRFAAAEVAAPAFKANAISLVLAGGIAGGFLGPEASRIAKDALPMPFLGSFVLLSGIALCAFAVQSLIRIPQIDTVGVKDAGRSIA